MDAHEVEDEDKRREQGVVRAVVYLSRIFAADPLDGGGGSSRGCGDESSDQFTLGCALGDYVVRIFPFAGVGISREAIKIAVELEDDVRRDGDVVVALVNLVQDVPIACDLSRRDFSDLFCWS